MYMILHLCMHDEDQKKMFCFLQGTPDPYFNKQTYMVVMVSFQAFFIQLCLNLFCFCLPWTGIKIMH